MPLPESVFLPFCTLQWIRRAETLQVVTRQACLHMASFSVPRHHFGLHHCQLGLSCQSSRFYTKGGVCRVTQSNLPAPAGQRLRACTTLRGCVLFVADLALFPT